MWLAHTCPAGRRYELRVKSYDGLLKNKYAIKKHRVCFSRTLLRDHQVRCTLLCVAVLGTRPADVPCCNRLASAAC